MDSSLSSSYSSSSSAPPHPPAPQIYDVFLSFRGEDTRYNFTSHLHKALDERGINTFIDYNLNRGGEISPALLTAIEESRISVIIFSKNYASSKWCLQELAKILECKSRETNKQIVIPVFYGVTPSDLRNQDGSFADVFAKHEKRFMQNPEQVHRWKDALKEAADLSGWPSSSDKSEAELIEAIVEDVWQKLYYLSSSDTSNLVGIHLKIKEIESLLCMGTNDVRGVGIWGMGGIGKTTLAEAVFNKISSQFKGFSYFARNVRQRCKQSNGLNCLQREFLLALVGDNKHANINVHAAGRTFIKNMFGRKKVLIAFDDVSDFTQIEGLIGGFDCLGPQSRIIITTRDKQVLKICGVKVYEVQNLINHEALELFRMYAFRRNHPTEDYMKLSERVVKYASGIPLALKVLGSHLYEKKIKVWVSAIKKMKRLPHMGIYKVLKISYDGLDNEEQRIFLDIALFFKGSSIEHVKSFLNGCGFATEVGIDVLRDKSLIGISLGIITMHDLLVAMAKEIVRRASIEDLGKRSRLWDHEEIYSILTKNTCTATIEGIALNMSRIRDDILLNPCDFEEMHRLRFLKFYNSSYEGISKVHVSQGLEYNFAALRYLSWHECSVKSLSSFSLKNLVILDMRGSEVEQLWNGVLPLAKLKEVDLRRSNLTSCPDLSGSPNLKQLNLSQCEYLCEISPSVGCLNELDFLGLSWCSSLKTIPDFSGLISLKVLDLLGCWNLETLHEMPCNLETFRLTSTVIEELPLSFGNLSRLLSLKLDPCVKLKRLPSPICKLKSLLILNLDGCSEFDQLPKDIGYLSSLTILSAEQTPIRELPSSMIDLKKCKLLRFSGFEVQDTIINLRFDLRNYMKLQLEGGHADNLTAIELLSSLCFQDCKPLSDFEDIVKNVLHAQQIFKKGCVLLSYPGSEVPKWFNFRSLGHFINLELSPNLLNQSFIGFAFCVVVAPHQYHHGDCDGSIKWACKLKSKDGLSFYWPGQFGAFSGQPNNVHVQSSILPFSFNTLLCDAKAVCFEFNYSIFSRGFYKIEKCGVHLMDAQYIEEVGGSSWVGKDENISSLANIHDNCEEFDKPHSKRLKKTPN